LGETVITDVEFTDNAFEKTSGEEKSECSLPDAIIEKWIHRGKGNQFYDTEEDNLLFVHQKTVVVTDYNSAKDIWLVVDVYRSQSPQMRHLERFSEVDTVDFKKSRQQNQ
jgi:hypothetical protein